MATDSIAITKPRSLGQLIAAHPTGFWFIFWGELAERCSYYGMMALLPRFISEFLGLGDGDSNTWVSVFKAACYFLPLLGGFLADQYLGKYRLIVIFSIPYILGHILLAGETYMWTLIALGLLAMGSGVIKPNISTLMGLTYDQKRPGDDQLRSLAFGMFYMAINIGATVSYFALPIIRDRFGYGVAFMCPAVLMAISFIIFAAGKPFYAVETIQRRASTPEEKAEKRLTFRRIAGLFLVITFFWAIFDQSHTTWIFFTRDFTDLNLFGWRFSTEQVGFFNPLLIIPFVPILTVIWVRLEARGIKARPTDKMMVGFFLIVLTMGVMAMAGFRAAQFESRPTVRGSSEQAPSLVTTPNLDLTKVKAAIETNAGKSIALDNINQLQLVWIPQDVNTRVEERVANTEWSILWGERPHDRVEIKSLAPIKVDRESEYMVTVTSPEPFSVTYAPDAENGIKLVAGERRLVPASGRVSLWWIVLAFVLLTIAEVLISVTGLELAFVVSPLSTKGFITALWLLTVGIANLFINAPVGRLYATMTPGSYFAMLSAMTVGVIVAFYFVSKRFNALGEKMKPAMSAEDAERILSDQVPRGGVSGTGIQSASEREGVK